MDIKVVGLDRVVGALSAIAKEAPAATARAMNRAIAQGRALASREIRQQVSLRKDYVDPRLPVRNASPARLEARISVPTRGRLLSRYAHKAAFATKSGKVVSGQSKSGSRKSVGYSVKIKPTGSFKQLPGAFKIRLKKGNVAGAGAEALVIRQEGSRKVKVLYGPSLSQVWNTVRGDVAPDVLQFYAKRAEHELQRLVERAAHAKLRK